MTFEGITTDILLSRANGDRKNIVGDVRGLMNACWGLWTGREGAISPEKLSLISAAIVVAPGQELGMKAEYILQFERLPQNGDIEPKRREFCCLISCTTFSKSRCIEIKCFEGGMYGTAKHDFEF
jgi:hypothetical protein